MRKEKNNSSLCRPWFLRPWGTERCRCGHARSSHRCDRPWQRCGNSTACQHETCDCDEFRPKK